MTSVSFQVDESGICLICHQFKSDPLHNSEYHWIADLTFLTLSSSENDLGVYSAPLRKVSATEGDSWKTSQKVKLARKDSGEKKFKTRQICLGRLWKTGNFGLVQKANGKKCDFIKLFCLRSFSSYDKRVRHFFPPDSLMWPSVESVYIGTASSEVINSSASGNFICSPYS